MKDQKSLEWIDCDERMPELGTECLVVLCWDDAQSYVAIDTFGYEVNIAGDDVWQDEWEGYSNDEITHWIPLSALPEVPSK